MQARIVGYCLKSALSRGFTFDGFKQPMVSKEPFGAYSAPVVTMPEPVKQFERICDALKIAQIAEGRNLRPYERQEINDALREARVILNGLNMKEEF